MKKLKMFITLITAGAYCLSFILCEPLKGIEILADSGNLSSRLSRMMEEAPLPYEWGKITDCRLYNNDTLVVCVQDLHCNPEVQRNIYNIINHFSEHSNVSAVFTEGAPQGRVNTKLLATLPRENVKKDVLDSLIRNGLIAGAEYYAVTRKNEKLCGLENWDVYTANKARIDLIFAGQERSRQQVDKVHGWVRELATKYLSNTIRSYERHIRKSKEGSSQAYYQGLQQLSAESGITFRAYPHLAKYFRLRQVSENINYDNLNLELHLYLQELKKNIPYRVFAKLINASKDKTDSGEYYLMLSELSRLYIPSARQYPDLEKYLEYVRLTSEINPLSLSCEEKLFVRRAVEEHAGSLVDKEILFMSEMDEYLANMYLLKINPQEYAFFKHNYSKFKALLRKYVDDRELDDVLSYFASRERELFAFYDTNCARNNIFFDSVKSYIGQTSLVEPAQAPEQLIDTYRLARYKNVVIMVAGGFHSDVALLFDKEGISNITVMPSVTTEYDNTVYRELVCGKLEVNRFINSMFSPILVDVAMEQGTIDVVIGKWARSAAEQGISIQNIQDDINAWMKENGILGKVEISSTDKNNVYSADIRGKNYTIDLNNSGTGKTEVSITALAKIYAGLAGILGFTVFSGASAQAATLNSAQQQASHGLNAGLIAMIAVGAAALGCIVVRAAHRSKVKIIRRSRAQNIREEKEASAAQRKTSKEFSIFDAPKEVWIALSLLTVGLSILGLFVSAPAFFIVTACLGLYAGVKALSAYKANAWLLGISVLAYGGLSFLGLTFVPAYSFLLPLAAFGYAIIKILTAKSSNTGASELCDSLFRWCIRAFNRTAANEMMKTHVFEKYGGEENVRKSLEAQGGDADELLGTEKSGTNWWLVYQKLEQLNQAYYTEKAYGEEVEKIHLGELWKNIKSELISKGKLDVRSSGIAVFYMVSGQFALHLFRGFYLRHLGSAMRYHWFGRNREAYIPQQEVSRIVVDQLREQEKLRSSFSGRVKMLGRQITGTLRPAFESALLSAHFRFLKERSTLFIVSTIITGKLLAFVALNPMLFLAVIGCLYIYAAIKWAPDKVESNGLLGARGWHIVRMVMIPAILAGLYLLSLSLGVPMLEMNILNTIPWLAAHTHSVPILGTLYKGFAVQAILSPLITVFIRSFWRSTRDARVSLLDKELFGLTLEKRYAEIVKNGKQVSIQYHPAADINEKEIADKKLQEARGFTDIYGKFRQWSWDGATVIAYLEAQKTSGNLSSQAAGIIHAVLEHDGKKRLGFNKLIHASGVQNEQIKTLLIGSLLAGSPAFRQPLSVTPEYIDVTIKEARLEARKETFGNSQFWKRLFSGWFSMWFVNTEIAIVLTQLGLFDKIISRFVSLFSENKIHIHIIEQLGQIIEGANPEHPIAQDGVLLYGSGSLMGKFVSPAEQGGYGGILGSLGSLVRDIGLSTYEIPYLGNVCFAASNVAGIINMNINGYVKADPVTGKTEKVKPHGIIDSVLTAKRLSNQTKISLAMPEAASLGGKYLEPDAGESLSVKESKPFQQEEVPDKASKSGNSAFIKDEIIFSNQHKEQPPLEPVPATEQVNNTGGNSGNAAGAPPPPPPEKNPALASEMFPLRADVASDRLFMSGVRNNTIVDTMNKDSTFHLNNHYNLFSQQTATSLSMQADPTGARHFISSLSLDQQSQPTGGFTVFKPGARGSYFDNRLQYSADLYSHKDEQYIQDGSPAGGSTEKILPKVSLRYSDANSGADLNFGAFNALGGGKKFTFSASQRIMFNDEFVMAPWADLAVKSAANQAMDPFIGNYGLVTRLYDFTTNIALRTTSTESKFTNDKIQYFRQFREGVGNVAVGMSNQIASRLNPNTGAAPEIFSLTNPNAASAPREYYVNMSQSKLIGVGAAKGDLKFSYFDQSQRLRLDLTQYMPAASEMLHAVNAGMDASVNAVSKGQVWAGAMFKDAGFRYKQTIGSFASLGAYTGQGEVFFNPIEKASVSIAGGVKDGKLPSLNAVMEYDISSKNLGSAALQFRADINGTSSTDMNGASVAPGDGKNTYGASVWAVFRFGDKQKNGPSSTIHTERSMNALENNTADTSRQQLAGDTDLSRRAYLLSQDNLTQQMLGIPTDFKFGSPSPYNQSIEKMLYNLAKKSDDNSGHFNGVEAQAEMKTAKKTANTSEREYVQDVIKATEEIADETVRKERMAVLRRSLQGKEGFLAEYQSLGQFSVTQSEAEAIKPKVEESRGRLLGQSEMDAKELKSYSDMLGDGHSAGDVSLLIEAKTEIRKTLGDNPGLQAELKAPPQKSPAYESMFRQFVEQKRFENGPSTELVTDNLREEFENNFSDWRISYYARQVVARYNEALGRSPGADPKSLWKSILSTADNELRLGKFMTSYKYRVTALQGDEIKKFGEALGKNVYEVETLQDNKGRIIELTGVSDKGVKLFKITNDNVMPVIELFDYPNGKAALAHSRVYQFHCNSAALESWVCGQAGSMNAGLIGIATGEKTYAIERRGSWFRWIDIKGTTYLPGHSATRYGGPTARAETDKNFEETFVRKENSDGTYTKFYEKAGMRDREEIYAWKLEEEMPVRKLYYTSEYGIPLEEVFEGQNNMQSKVYLWSEEAGRRTEKLIFENAYTYDNGRYNRIIKTKINKVTGLREEWSDVSAGESAIKYTGRVITPNGAVMSVKTRTQERYSFERTETSEDFGSTKDIKKVNLLSGKESLARSDVKGLRIYTETSGPGDNTYTRSFVREYADKRPNESGWSNLRTAESRFTAYNLKKAGMVTIVSSAAEMPSMGQEYVREDITERTITYGRKNTLTGAETSITYAASDTSKKNPLYRTEISEMDYSTMKKTTTTTAYDDRGRVEWTKARQTGTASGAIKNFFAGQSKDVFEVETVRDSSGRITELTGISSKGLKLFKIENNNVMPTMEVYDYSQCSDGNCARALIYEFHDPMLSGGVAGAMKAGSIGRILGEKSYKMERRGDLMRLVDVKGVKFLPGHREIRFGEPYKHGPMDNNFEEAYTRKENQDGSYTRYYEKAGLKDREETFLWRLEDEVPVRKVTYATELGVALEEVFEGSNNLRSKVYLAGKNGSLTDRLVYEKTYTYDLRHHDRIVKSINNKATGLREEWSDVSPDDSNIKFQAKIIAPNGKVIAVKTTSQERYSIERTEAKAEISGVKTSKTANIISGEEKLEKSDYKGNRLYTETSSPGNNVYRRAFEREYDDKRMIESGWSDLRTNESELTVLSRKDHPVAVTRFGSVDPKTMEQAYTRSDITEQTDTRGKLNVLDGAESSVTYSSSDKAQERPLYETEISATDYAEMKKASSTAKYREDKKGRDKGLLEWIERGYVNPLYGAGNFTKTLADGTIESMASGLGADNKPLANKSGNYYRQVTHKLLGQKEVVTLSYDLTPREAVRTTLDGANIETKQLNLRAKDGSIVNKAQEANGEIVVERLDRFNGSPLTKERYLTDGATRISKTDYGFKKDKKGNTYFSALTVNDGLDTETEELRGCHRGGYPQRFETRNKNTKESISMLSSDDGMYFTGYNYESKELSTQEALYIGGPAVTKVTFTPAAKDTGSVDEIKSKETLSIIEGGAATVTTQFPKSGSSKTDQYDFYGSVLKSSVEKGPAGFVVSNITRQNNEGTVYKAVHYNGNIETITLDQPEGVIVKAEVTDSRGLNIYSMQNNGNVNTYKYANKDETTQVLKYHGGPVETTKTLSPSGKHIKALGEARFNNAKKRWELLLTYPGSNSKHFEDKEFLWRGGPAARETLLSKDNTRVSQTDYGLNSSDNEFHKVTRLFGDHNENDEIRTEDYALLFMNGPPAGRDGSGTITDYRYKYDGKNSPTAKETVTYKVDIKYSGAAFAKRTDTTYRVENGERMSDFDTRQALKLILGEWKPVKTEERYEKWLLPTHGLLTTTYSYDDNNTGLPLETKSDYIDPGRAPYTFRVKNEQLFNEAELLAKKDRSQQDYNALNSIKRVRDKIKELTGKNGVPLVDLPVDDLVAGMVYETDGPSGKTGAYLGMNIYVNDFAGLRLVAAEKINIATSETRLNVLYEQDNGQVVGHGYTRGKSGFFGSVDAGVDYPVYLTLAGPWKNDLVSVNRAPLFHGKDEVKGNEVQEYFPLAYKNRLLFKAYDAVLGKIYQLKNLDIDPQTGSFVYQKGKEKMTVAYKSSREGKEQMPEFYVDSRAALRAVAAILAAAFVLPYILIKIYRRIKKVPAALTDGPGQENAAVQGSASTAVSNSGKIEIGVNGGLNGDILDPVEKSEKLLSEWEYLLETVKEKGFARQDIDNMLNKAMFVINLTPFQVKQADRNLVGLNKNYEKMRLLSIKTRNVLKSSVKKVSGIKKEDMEELNLIISEFGDIAKYSANYVNLVVSIYNLKVMSGCILPKNSILERKMPVLNVSVMMIVRFIYGFWLGIGVSSRRANQVRKIAILGNNIDPELYDVGRTISETDEYVNAVLNQENAQAVGIPKFWKSREAAAKIMGAIMFLNIIFTLAMISSGITLNTVISIVCGTGIAVGGSWLFILRGLEKNVENIKTENYTEKFLALEHGAALKSWQKEMASEKPDADIIIVMATGANVKKYEDLFSGSAGTLMRKGVPFKVVPYEGNDGAAHAEAYHYILKHHPELNSGRAVILVTGANEWKNITKPVAGPGGEKLTFPDGREIINIEYQLMNGYQAAQSLAAEGRGGKIFIDAELHYAGPVRRRGEITMVGSWASYDQVKQQNLKLALDTREGRARKIYDDFKLEEINDKLLRQMLKGVYDKTNPRKRQMPVLGGINIYSFDTPQKEQEFVELLDGEPRGFKMTRDVIKPLILLKNEGSREMFKSLFYRDIIADEAQRDPLFELFDVYQQRYSKQGSMPFDFWLYMPSLHETYITAGPRQDADVAPAPLTRVAAAGSGENTPVGGHGYVNGYVMSPYERSEKLLDEWQELLDDKRGNFTEEDAVSARNKVKLIMSLTVFSADKTKRDLIILNSIYERLSRLSEETIGALEESYRRQPRPDENTSEKLELMISEFNVITKYGITYVSAVSSISSLELLSGYVMKSRHPFELIGAMGFMRFWFGFTYGIVLASFRLKKRVRKIVELGNIVDPELYDNPGATAREADQYAYSIEHQKSNNAIGIGKHWKMRRALPRILGLLVFLVSIVSITLFHTGIPVNFIISLIAFGGISVGVSWYYIWRGLQEGYDRDIKSAGARSERFWAENYTERFRSVEHRATLKAFEKEMSPGEKPSADIILIMATRENAAKYEKLLLESMRAFARQDIPFKVVPYEGNDGAAYAEAYNYLSDNYPALKKNGRAVILVTGTNQWKSITSPVSIPGVENVALPGGREIKNIEYQLMNGYKAAQSLAAENRGGKIFIDAELQYVGPVRRRGEVTLVGSWANYKQVGAENLKLVIDMPDGRARKIYDVNNLEEVSEKMERHMLTSIYDKTNTKKRQMPVLSGITLFSFEDEEHEDAFVEVLNNEPQDFNIVKDVLSPLISLKREGFIEMYKSIISRNSFMDREKRESLLRILDQYQERYGGENAMPFDFWVYMPNTHETYISRGPAHHDPVGGSNVPPPAGPGAAAGPDVSGDSSAGTPAEPVVEPVTNAELAIIQRAEGLVTTAVKSLATNIERTFGAIPAAKLGQQLSISLLTRPGALGVAFGSIAEEAFAGSSESSGIALLVARQLSRKVPVKPEPLRRYKTGSGAQGFIDKYAARGIKIITCRGYASINGAMGINRGVYGYATTGSNKGEFLVSEGFWAHFQTDDERDTIIKHEQSEQAWLDRNQGKSFEEYHRYVRSEMVRQSIDSLNGREYGGYSIKCIISGDKIDIEIETPEGPVEVRVAADDKQFSAFITALSAQSGQPEFQHNFQRSVSEYASTIKTLPAADESADEISEQTVVEPARKPEVSEPEAVYKTVAVVTAADTQSEALPENKADPLPEPDAKNLAVPQNSVKETEGIVLSRVEKSRPDSLNPNFAAAKFAFRPPSAGLTPPEAAHSAYFSIEKSGLKDVQRLLYQEELRGRIEETLAGINPAEALMEDMAVQGAAKLEKSGQPRVEQAGQPKNPENTRLPVSEKNAVLVKEDEAIEDLKAGSENNLTAEKLAESVPEEMQKQYESPAVLTAKPAYAISEKTKAKPAKTFREFRKVKSDTTLANKAAYAGLRHYFKGRVGAQKLSRAVAVGLMQNEKYGLKAVEACVNEVGILMTIRIPEYETVPPVSGSLTQTLNMVAAKQYKIEVLKGAFSRTSVPLLFAFTTANIFEDLISKNLSYPRKRVSRDFIPSMRKHWIPARHSASSTFAGMTKHLYGSTLSRGMAPAVFKMPEQENLMAGPPRAPAARPQILELRNIVEHETGPLGKASNPLAVPGEIGRILERFDSSQAIKTTVEGSSVIPVSYQVTKSFMHQITELAALGKGGIGVTLLCKTTAVRQEDLVYAGNLIVPVEGTDINVSVYAEIIQRKDGKAAGVLYLDADETQTSPEAQVIADLAYSAESASQQQQKQSAMKLLGRGALVLVKELKEGKREFREALEAMGLPAAALEPAVILMNNIETAYAVPRLVNDDYAGDNYLNALAYAFLTDNLNKEEIPFSEVAEPAVNPGLFAYSILDTKSNNFDLMKAVLLSVDNVAVASDDKIVSGSANYPEFAELIVKIRRDPFNRKLDPALDEWITELWQNKHAQKTAYWEAMRVDKPFNSILDATSVAPIVAVRSFSDIPEIAERLSKAGINTMVLDSCFPVKAIDGQLRGALSSYGCNLACVDCIQEAERLKMRTFEINRLKNLLPDNQTDSPQDNDGLLENQFYAAIELYQNLLRRNSKLREYENFTSAAPWWAEIKNYSSYLAYQRIAGRPPENKEALSLWDARTDSQTHMKYVFYCAVYEYMNYVAYNQLKAAVSAVHTNIAAMKVLMNYTVLKSRDSADVIFHPELFSDSAGNLISPCIDGRFNSGVVLQNWHAMQSQKYMPLKKNLEYWFREFGFDGGKLSGIHAYNTIMENSFTADILFTELSDTIRGVNRSALIIVEPFKGYSMNADLRRQKGIYQILTVPAGGEVSVIKIRQEAGGSGKLWVNISDDGEQSRKELLSAITAIAGTGLAAYVSFDLRSKDVLGAPGPGEGDIISFLKNMPALIGSPGPASARGSFDTGYRMGSALPIQPSECVAAEKGARQIYEALDIRSSNENFSDAACSALKNAGLDETAAPCLWNDIKLIQMRANARGRSENLQRDNSELAGYIRGYMENALYQGYLARTGGKAAREPDVFKKLLADAASCVAYNDKNEPGLATGYAESNLGDIRAELMNFSGILIASGKLKEAKDVLRDIASRQNSEGMIPGRILADGAAEYGYSDVPLWFIEDVNLYCRIARDDDKTVFIKEMLPVINRILDCYTRETGAIQMDDTDQLVVVRDHSTQPDPAGSAAPRGGKPVEIQALFYNALRIASDLNTLEGNNDKAEHFDALSLKTARSINERYFKQGEVYPYDVLDGGETVKHDVRPHALLLISLSETGGLLSDAKKELIIDTVEKRLLTPYGLRSLAPENENYSSGSETGAALKVANSLDGQGSVWPYYFSPYFQAKVKVALGQGHSRYSRIKGELKNHINNLLYMAKEGPLPEVFSGSAPYTPGFSQGSSIYSVSSLIECMALLNSEFPLQGYSIASRQNVRLENLVKILASF